MSLFGDLLVEGAARGTIEVDVPSVRTGSIGPAEVFGETSQPKSVTGDIPRAVITGPRVLSLG